MTELNCEVCRWHARALDARLGRVIERAPA